MRSWIFALTMGANILSFSDAQNPFQKERSSAIFFYSNDDNRGFENAKPPSDVVLDALLETPQVKESLDDIEDQSRESLRSYFKVALANAGGPQDEIYVVTSTKLPLGSGDSDWFWIVQTDKQKARVILFIIGHTLTFKKHRTNGYRDLLETTGTPGQPEENLFRYDGKAYRLSRERLQTVKP